jgi:excisionase family DNA binding protein
VEPLLLTVSAAAEVLGLGRSKVYELIARKELESVRVGRARRVPRASLEAYVSRLCGDPGGDAA